MKNALVILAGGKGERIGSNIPKQFIKYGAYNFIEHLFGNIKIEIFDILVIVCHKKYVKKYLKDLNNISNFTKILICKPGNNRQESSLNSLIKLKKYKPKNVLIHDAARPLVSNKLIKRILITLKNNENAIPYITYNDRKIHKKNEIISKIKNIQTPQGFHYKIILNAHLKFKNQNLTDDASLIEKLGKKIKYIKGEKTNLKITYPEDINFYNLVKNKFFSYGIGYDIHRFDFKLKKGLKLCGIEIPYYKLTGHSDADVGMHAICDSIFGALSMNDIGYYFSNKDAKWKNADSKIFIKFCKEKLIEKKLFIVNLDINLICEQPIISIYKKSMIKNISKLLSIPEKIISIKATTNEKIGFIGNNEGIAAESIVQIANDKFY